MDLQIRQLNGADYNIFTDVLAIFEDVFEMKDFEIPGAMQLQQILWKPGFVVWAAFHDNKVIGGLTGYILPSYYFPSSELYIYDFAIRTTY